MQYTEKNKFNLPEPTDYVDINKLNENFERLDEFLKEHPRITVRSPTGSPHIVALKFGDKIAVVTNLERDDNGHVTNFEIKVLELPKLPENLGSGTGVDSITPEEIDEACDYLPVDDSGIKPLTDEQIDEICTV